MSEQGRRARQGHRLPVVPSPDTAAAERLVSGLAKISLALKHHATKEAMPRGLSPTQAQVLALLRARRSMRLGEIASALAVTAATASDAVRSLDEKGLVAKEKSPDDARALAITLTKDGAREAERVSEWPDFLLRAADELSEHEQEVLLVALVKMIRALQERGEIPIAKMCVTCTHFRPNVHEGDAPHHCAFVDAPFGPRALRLDCVDHTPSSPEKAALDWARFTG